MTGRPEEAIAEIERALESAPLNISYNRSFALCMFVVRREAEAILQKLGDGQFPYARELRQSPRWPAWPK